MKPVYIAASFNNREGAKKAREVLTKKGYVSTAKWIDTHLSDLDNLTDETRKNEAIEDLRDIMRAEAVVFINTPNIPSSSGGQHLEMGFAFAEGMLVYLVGPRTSVFHYHPQIRQVDRIEDMPEAK